MKKLKFLSTALLATLVFTACSSDDDNPQPVNEEEVITTMTVTLTPEAGGGTPIVLKSQDLDGDGPNAPVITVSGNLAAGTTYTGLLVLLNETVNPADNITLEVIAESKEHQFFYIPTSSLNITTAYADFDTDGNPLGTKITLAAAAASSGTLTITLRHEPKKPNDGTLTDAGGETDFSATFNIIVE
jgi:hypothetical protein